MLYAVITFVVCFGVFRALKVPLRPALVAAIVLTLLGRALVNAASFGPWAWIIVCLLLTPYWLGPFLVHQGQRVSANPALVPFDSSRHRTPEEIETPRQDSIRTLVGAGFRPVADLFNDDYIPNVTMRVSLLENAATRQHAIACGMWASSGPATTKSTWVEFSATLSDGRRFLVNNSSQLGAFATVKDRVIESLPLVDDVVRLARVHRVLADRVRAGAEIEMPSDGGDPAGHLARAMAHDANTQIGTGYLRLDERAGVLRPTLKGAVLMTWKLLPPFSTIRRARLARRAKGLLRSLGPDGGNGGTTGATTSAMPWAAAAVLIAALGGAAGTGSLVPAALRAETVPSGFTVPRDFPGALLALEQLAGTSAGPLIVTDSNGTRQRVDGAVVRVSGPPAEALIAAAQPLFRERGFYLFRLDQNYGIGGEPDELALVPLADPYAIVSLVGTNGANYDLSTSAIADTLRALHNDEPFVLTGIGFDYVEGRFRHSVRDPLVLAHRVYALCPDIVHQGMGSVDALADEIRRTNALYCWWD